MEGPKPVSIFGFGSRRHPEVEKTLLANGVRIVDLTQRLHDPERTARCLQGEDGSYDKTMIGVYQNDVFADIMIEELHRVNKDHNITPHETIAFKCRSSFHRTDVSVRTMESCLQHVNDTVGAQCYNVMTFNCCRVNSNKEAAYTIEQGLKWCMDPWVAPVPAIDRYASQAVRQRSECQATFDRIWALFPWIDDFENVHALVPTRRKLDEIADNDDSDGDDSAVELIPPTKKPRKMVQLPMKDTSTPIRAWKERNRVCIVCSTKGCPQIKNPTT
jgi:hypothetical protein